MEYRLILHTFKDNFVCYPWVDGEKVPEYLNREGEVYKYEMTCYYKENGEYVCLPDLPKYAEEVTKVDYHYYKLTTHSLSSVWFREYWEKPLYPYSPEKVENKNE